MAACNDEFINMKKKVQAICSTVALIAFVALGLSRSAFINSSECKVTPVCYKAEYAWLLGLMAGLYLAVELLIAPKSSILFIIRDALPGGKLSTEWYRASGLFGIIVMLLMIYIAIMQIAGSSP
jgi:hypothetical protein